MLEMEKLLHDAGLAKLNKSNQLKDLIAVPFDITNDIQKNAVLEYVENFEFSTHQMYIYLFMSDSLKKVALPSASISLLTSKLSDLVCYLQYIFISIGVSCLLAKNFKKNDFHAEFVLMKILYEWCFSKNSKQASLELLANPVIQRLVKCLAPFCTVAFMKQNWPLDLKETQAKPHAIPFVGFFSSVKIVTPSDEVIQLFEAVSNEQLKVGNTEGFKQALKYFSKGNNFKKILSSSAQLAATVVPNISSVTTGLGL